MLSLTPGCPTCRNGPDTRAAIGINDRYDPTQEVHPGDDEALLAVSIGIFTPKRVSILEHAYRISEVNAMPAQVRGGFVRVPSIALVYRQTCIHARVHVCLPQSS
jgi:hypothetical protein